MEKKKNILVVEDDPVSVKLLTSSLETAGYEVKVASHGREALKRIQESPPDLVITDVCMPEMDGFAFYKELKKNKTTSELPVIVLTARGKMGDTFEVLGADAFITKPFNTKELLEKIELLVATKSSATKPSVELPATQQKQAKEPVAWGSYIGMAMLGLFVVMVVGGTISLVSYMINAGQKKKIPAQYQPQDLNEQDLVVNEEI